MAEICSNKLPSHCVGPVSVFQVFPALSLTPLMLTASPPGWGHTGWLDTNATRVVAPMELNAGVVCTVCALPWIYPVLLTTAGVACAKAAFA